jgi:hypothetical protein
MDIETGEEDSWEIFPGGLSPFAAAENMLKYDR